MSFPFLLFMILAVFDKVKQCLSSLINTMVALVWQTQAGVNLTNRNVLLKQCIKHLVNQLVALLLTLHRAKRIGEECCGKTLVLGSAKSETLALYKDILRTIPV